MIYVLVKWSSSDVKDNPVYVLFYLAMWLGWTGIWNLVLPFLGLSCRDDVLERDNTAAGLAICGGLLGVTFVFAGSNIGEGPGWWVVVFCAALGTGALLALWVLGDGLSGVIEAITVDRDIAAGWRTAGFYIGAGLILGRALAGDWHSAQETVLDFFTKGAPALLLWAVTVAVDMLGKPTPKRPAPDPFIFGFLPFAALILAGLADVAMQGPWS